MCKFVEIARDSLHSTGRYKVVGGIISPVSDRYSRKVSLFVVFKVTVLFIVWLLKQASYLLFLSAVFWCKKGELITWITTIIFLVFAFIL